MKAIWVQNGNPVFARRRESRAKTGIDYEGVVKPAGNRILIGLCADSPGKGQFRIRHGDLKSDLLIMNVNVHGGVGIRMAGVLRCPG